jgi:hypothetical protein
LSLAKLQTAVNANAGRVLQLEHPDDRTPLFFDTEKKVPVQLTLLGKDSDAYIKAERHNRNRAVENIKKRVAFSAAEDDRLGAETLARCTTAWQGIPQGWIDSSDNEEPAEYSYDNALRMYENAGVAWVKEQADDFIGKRANFLKA